MAEKRNEGCHLEAMEGLPKEDRADIHLWKAVDHIPPGDIRYDEIHASFYAYWKRPN